MSSTIIYPFRKDGTCDSDGEISIKNPWHGAMSVWRTLEERYLPQYRPRYVPQDVTDDMVETWCGYKPSRISSFDPSASNAIWELFDNAEKVSETDRIVLDTTLDDVLVRREEIPRVIKALDDFDGKTENHEAQIEALYMILEDSADYAAVGWNQMSVICDDWSNKGAVAVDADGIEWKMPYNFRTGNKHWWLFDDLDKSAEAQHE